MVVALATRIRAPVGKSHFFSGLRRPFFLPQTPKMVEIEAKSKRPTCPTCSKPAWLCLCSRIKIPELHNSVSVTILQHSLEKKHPLNSTRIAVLGLKNVTVATVSDVNFEARFVIRLLDSNSEMGSLKSSIGMELDRFEGTIETQKLVFEHCNGITREEENVGDLAYEVFAKCPEEKSNGFIDNDARCSLVSDIIVSENTQNQSECLGFVRKSGLSMSNVTASDAEDEMAVQKGSDASDLFALETSNKQLVKQSNGDETSAAIKFNAVSDENKLSTLDYNPIEGGMEVPIITATIGKQGVVSHLSHIWLLQNDCEKQNFDKISEAPAARNILAKGFIVQKLQKRQQEGSLELEEFIEFELKIPPGSVLLFPTAEALSVNELKATNFEVKNLIVLDGTWAKAKRIYAENPWLKLLPHLKLELDKVSLYNGVRMQPKAGCLSTIESIVYTLKAVGDDNLEGLDNLLDVFESMVGDQRRCKEKRLKSAP